jgi:hypothetical protein
MATPFKNNEELGKMFEMAICLTYGIEYDGKYKYDMEFPRAIQTRLAKLPELFPKCSHSAKAGSRYDFTSIDNPTLHLSAKTNRDKNSCKVAPQGGQAQPKKFCEELDIPYTDTPTLKKYIQTNIASILHYSMTHTFDCPNIYYNHATNEILFIKMIKEIDWSKMTYDWTRLGDEWVHRDGSTDGGSSTLKIKTSRGFVPLMEFQFHSTGRTNMAFRWCYDNVLDIFRDNFSITAL